MSWSPPFWAGSFLALASFDFLVDFSVEEALGVEGAGVDGCARRDPLVNAHASDRLSENFSAEPAEQVKQCGK